MSKSELIFVVGPKAAGKSSFIRTRINDLDGCEIIMTDVYKGRTKIVFNEAIARRKDIILETVFNDASFKDLADQASAAGYHTSMIVLFLDSIKHSQERVAFRTIEQNGMTISGTNIKLNFNENFKNVAQYFFYFDQSEFIYTGITGKNSPIMSFVRSELVSYEANELEYPQRFAQFSHQHQRLNEEAFNAIRNNRNYRIKEVHTVERPRRRLKL